MSINNRIKPGPATYELRHLQDLASSRAIRDGLVCMFALRYPELEMDLELIAAARLGWHGKLGNLMAFVQLREPMCMTLVWRLGVAVARVKLLERQEWKRQVAKA